MNNLATIARIRATLEQRGVIKPGVTATQGYLRLQQTVNTGASISAITFNVLANQGTVLNVEQRLAITDMFTVTHWALYIARCPQTTTTAPTALQIAQSRFYTNNNSLVFSDTTNTPNESPAFMSMYNGSINVTIDRERIIDGYDAYRFYRAGEAQQGLANAAIAGPVTYPFTNDTWQGPNYGFAEVDPEFTLNGVGQNDITVTFANSVNLTAASGSCNMLAFVLRGIRWQQASKLNA